MELIFQLVNRLNGVRIPVKVVARLFVGFASLNPEEKPNENRSRPESRGTRWTPAERIRKS